MVSFPTPSAINSSDLKFHDFSSGRPGSPQHCAWGRITLTPIIGHRTEGSAMSPAREPTSFPSPVSWPCFWSWVSLSTVYIDMAYGTEKPKGLPCPKNSSICHWPPANLRLPNSLWWLFYCSCSRRASGDCWPITRFIRAVFSFLLWPNSFPMNSYSQSQTENTSYRLSVPYEIPLIHTYWNHTVILIHLVIVPIIPKVFVLFIKICINHAN